MRIKELAEPTDGQLAGPMALSNRTHAIANSINAAPVGYTTSPNRVIQQDVRVFISAVAVTFSTGTPASRSWHPIQHLPSLPRNRS